jgi:hypothetical protein
MYCTYVPVKKNIEVCSPVNLCMCAGDLVLSFAQMTLSRITICSSSTFCLWPALTSEGTAYFPHSTLLYSGQVGPVRQVAPPNFKLLMAPRIMTFAGYTSNLPHMLGRLHQPVDNVDIL